MCEKAEILQIKLKYVKLNMSRIYHFARLIYSVLVKICIIYTKIPGLVISINYEVKW